jgi:hypothetical protein
MAGHHPSSTNCAMTRVLPSLSSSPRLPGSLEDSRNRVGIIKVIIRMMRKPSYFQSTENRFTGSLRLRKLSIVVQIVVLALEVRH